ncbi:MAG: class I SAM-dependent methyltransferase [Clostridia bacterium]|nr:class I SAM-dependent methyltransferase [Clostridia bacterium]
MDLYDYPEIYDERWSDGANRAYRKHYEKVLAGCNITDILDCSIGTGNLSFCLCELGYQLTGSDLSESMLRKAREKAEQKGFEVPLVCCDFRELTKHFSKTFSCVMSTGNAFAHVDHDGVVKTLEEMASLVKPGGYLYFDSRNWEKELAEKKRFQFARPFVRSDGVRINYVQVWDYHQDGKITINILQAYEKDKKIIQQDVYEEHLNPFPIKLCVDTLDRLGFSDFTIKPTPYVEDKPFGEIGWYCLMARKSW